MFNITQVGNVVNIDSPDVEFDITVSLISGTSFQVANIEAIGYSWEVTSSGTVANIKLIVSGWTLRNCGQYSGYGTRGLEFPNELRDATGIAGSYVHVDTCAQVGHYNGHHGEPWTIPVVRNGDYIYYPITTTASDAAHEIIICEYKISTGYHNYVKVCDIAPISPSYYHSHYIAWIEDRKILCNPRIPTEQYQNIHIVDCATGISTLSMTLDTGGTVPEVIGVYTIKKDDGKVWLYALVTFYGWGTEYEEDAVIFYYKNYTDGGSWNSVTQSLAIAGRDVYCWTGTDAVFIKDDYLVACYIAQNDQDPCYYVALGLNLGTHTITYNTLAGESNWVAYTFFATPDNDSGLVYCWLDSFKFNGQDTYPILASYNPATNAIEAAYVSSPGCDRLYIGSSRHKVYFIDVTHGEEPDLYRANPFTLIKSGWTLPQSTLYDNWWGNVCIEFDDIGPSIWYHGDVDNTIKRASLDGTTILDSVPFVSLNYPWMIHLGDMIWVSNDIEIYLIT